MGKYAEIGNPSELGGNSVEKLYLTLALLTLSLAAAPALATEGPDWPHAVVQNTCLRPNGFITVTFQMRNISGHPKEWVINRHHEMAYMGTVAAREDDLIVLYMNVETYLSMMTGSRTFTFTPQTPHRGTLLKGAPIILHTKLLMPTEDCPPEPVATD